MAAQRYRLVKRARSLIASLIAEHLLDQVVVWILGWQQVRVVGFELVPEPLTDHGIGHLVGVEAIDGLDQLPSLSALLRPVVDNF
jgi:hypothetical protein